MAEVKDFNRRLFAAAAKAGYTTGDPNGWQQGALAFRYSGWCTRRFSSLGLVFELNSRSAQSLSLTELQRLGALLGRELAAYMQTEQFAAVHTRAKAALAKRKTDREERWTRKGITPATRTPYELFCLGY
jgi:hypothetical protein